LNSDRVGTSVPRVGGYERVTGQQKFVGDIRLDDMLYVKLITIDCAHARILHINTEHARALPGVRDVVCAADLPNPMPRFGPVYQDRPVLAAAETRRPDFTVNQSQPSSRRPSRWLKRQPPWSRSATRNSPR
jgi:CO/xanthine dehydrogenase Mo-binding subunit